MFQIWIQEKLGFVEFKNLQLIFVLYIICKCSEVLQIYNLFSLVYKEFETQPLLCEGFSKNYI